jgi:ACS family pantothenate transporter-like MFS transporter
MLVPDAESKTIRDTVTTPTESEDGDQPSQRLPLSKRILGTIWDSLNKSPEERKLIAKLDWWILSYVCVAYFIKYLDQTNVGLLLFSSFFLWNDSNLFSIGTGFKCICLGNERRS